mmetsp:Transcript_9559/g.17958  ORF Transcript_9559/g.17958 Transcript_9559/m.17958 type:complete len:675 (+) Transcript_9559:21-2045(+)
MNYAEDRIDRKARHIDNSSNLSPLEIDLYQAHEYLKQGQESNSCNCTSSSSSSVRTKIKGHELAGRTLRDAGFCAHATFHYGMAWILSYSLKNNELDDRSYGQDESDMGDEVARAVGDYAQMVELAGYPEFAVLSLLFYHCGGTLDIIEYERIHASYNRQHGTNNEQKKIMSFSLGMNCGCGFEECGASVCFVSKQMIGSKILDTILADIDLLEEYYHDLSERTLLNSKKSICASDILEVIAKSTTRMRREQGRTTDLDLSNHWDYIPSCLRFWSNDGPCPLSPLLKILSLKILFSSPIASSFLFLACESLCHLAISLPLTSSLGRRMATTHKSHWAFYVLIHKLILGEKVKSHRRETIPYHVPVWDIVFSLDQRKFHRQLLGKTAATPTFATAIHDGTNMEQRHFTLGNHLRNLIAHINRVEDNVVRTSFPLPFPRCLPAEYRQDNIGVIYVIGDSHVLSLGWQTICISNQCHYFYRTLVPATITGLKAWHTRTDTHFFTKYNLDRCLERLPKFCKTIIMSAGEIDCREGIGGNLLQGYQDECDDAVRNTVVQYVTAIQALASKYRLQVLLLPVAPHAHRSHKNGKSLGRGLRRRRMLLWNETLREECEKIDTEEQNVFLLDYEVGLREENRESPVGFVLNKHYNADYTHMNSAFLPLLEKSIVDCKCDLSLV